VPRCSVRENGLWADDVVMGTLCELPELQSCAMTQLPHCYYVAIPFLGFRAAFGGGRDFKNECQTRPSPKFLSLPGRRLHRPAGLTQFREFAPFIGDRTEIGAMMLCFIPGTTSIGQIAHLSRGKTSRVVSHPRAHTNSYSCGRIGRQ